MTTNEFIQGIGDNWASVKPGAVKTYSRKLDRFTDRERELIFDFLLERNRTTPKIADVYRVARMFRFGKDEEETEMRILESWSKTNCVFCGGRGLVSVIKYQKGDQVITINAAPIGASWDGIQWEPEISEAITRCLCAAGVRPDMPGNFRMFPILEADEFELRRAA